MRRSKHAIVRLACAVLGLGLGLDRIAHGQGAPASEPAPAVTSTGEPAPAAEPAPAEPTPEPAPEPTPEQRETARAAYDRGRILFGQSKFADARAAFQEAYDAVPNPIVLLSIGECQLRLGNYEDAFTALTQYLADRPDAPERADVETKLAEITAVSATLVITTLPSGARIRLDGVDTGQVTPAEVPLARGEHKLELLLEGHTAIVENVTTKAGVRHELHAELRALPLPPPPVAVAPPPPAPPPAHKAPNEVIWFTGILGATGIVTGSVLGFLALSERSDFDRNPTAASANRGERLALFADVAFGVGAMAALTAVVLYITSDDEPADAAASAKAPARRAEPSFAVLPAVGPQHVGLLTEGRF